MSRLTLSGAALALILTATYFWSTLNPAPEAHKNHLEDKHVPSDYFFLQRSYPDQNFSLNAYESALKDALVRRQTENTAPGFDEDWTTQGPGNIGGRINAVAVHPSNSDIIYAGTTAGGIFKTTDGGGNWTPIFDDQPFLAIGHIELDPSDPNTVYVGTGDPNISGYPFIGDGIYKSTDGGQTWTHLGLTAQRIISRIVVHPTNSSIIYAATMGLPFERNNDRGLYKSTDGGQSWNQVLFVSNQAGIIDLIMDPRNPNTLYAASWDRIRNNTESTAWGPDAAVWKTTDGGANWARLTNGLPQTDMSRVGITMSAQDPQKLYAMYINTSYQVENIFKTTNGGTSWDTIPTDDLNGNAMGGFGWYFGQIRVNPSDDDEIWVLGVRLYASMNGGTTWSRFAPNNANPFVHVDMHDLRFFDGDNALLATDGGLYSTSNGGQSWTDIENLPITQFYRVAINPHRPDFYYGGAQDNGSLGGNLANFNSWEHYYGGDGFQLRFDPSNSQVWYAEWQNGNIVVTTDNGNSWDPHTFGIDPGDRRHWDMQYVLSDNNPNLQYTGTYRAYINTQGPNADWKPMSPDLTDGLILHPRFHSISSINVSALDDSLVYAGTTDGNVWVKRANQTWSNITTGLPDRYVSCVKPSPISMATAFASHSGYKDNDFIPHVHRTDDYGANWTDISGDLPQLAVNDLLIWPLDDNVIFAATDGGVYGTINGGQNWYCVGGNVPVMTVYDLEFNMDTRELVAGTFARSILTYPVDSILNQIGNTASLFSGKEQPLLRIYPNPATDQVWVKGLPENTSRLEGKLFDLSGKQLKGFVFEEGSPLDISGLPSGSYLLRLEGKGQSFSGRLVKR